MRSQLKSLRLCGYVDERPWVQGLAPDAGNCTSEGLSRTPHMAERCKACQIELTKKGGKNLASILHMSDELLCLEIQDIYHILCLRLHCVIIHLQKKSCPLKYGTSSHLQAVFIHETHLQYYCYRQKWMQDVVQCSIYCLPNARVLIPNICLSPLSFKFFSAPKSCFSC